MALRLMLAIRGHYLQSNKFYNRMCQCLINEKRVIGNKGDGEHYIEDDIVGNCH